MGNKSGKFSVPNTAAVNKDEAVINENAVKVEETHNGDVHVEDIKTDEKAATETDNTVPPKGKKTMSWLKKFSIKKEKKPKAPKQNGVKEDVPAAPKENGDVEEVAPKEDVKIEETVAISIVDDVQCEQNNEASTKEDEAHSEKSAVECNGNGIESSESHAEEQKVDCVD